MTKKLKIKYDCLKPHGVILTVNKFNKCFGIFISIYVGLDDCYMWNF